MAAVGRYVEVYIAANSSHSGEAGCANPAVKKA